jgi:hypothetical protein
MSLYEPVFHALEASGTRYVVVGGMALVLHGLPKITADLDVVIDLEPAAARAALGALHKLGLEPRVPVTIEQFLDRDTRLALVRERGMLVYSWWAPKVPLCEVDVFAEHPLDFDVLWQRAVIIQLRTVNVRVGCLEDLLTLKHLSSRGDDDADIRALLRRAAGPRSS